MISDVTTPRPPSAPANRQIRRLNRPPMKRLIRKHMRGAPAGPADRATPGGFPSASAKRQSLKPVLPLAAKTRRAAVAHFRIWAVGGRWRLPGPMSADVRHMAPTPGPLRSPPALRVPWGHAPPIWRPGGPRRRPHHARFGRWLGGGPGRRPPHMATAEPHMANPRTRGGCSLSLTPHRTPLAH